jgi:restriction endonuclease S subunit
MVLRAKPDVVLPEFLPFFMQSDLFMNRAVEISVGSLSPTINWKTMAVQEFALPPLNEQQRIVDLLRAIDENSESIVSAINALSQVRAGFIEDFIAKKSLTCPTISLVNGCVRVTDGTHQPPTFTEQGIPFFLVKTISSGYVDWGHIKYVSQATYLELTRRVRPKRGDVLYTAVGATYGVALLVNFDDPFVFQRHIAHIVPNPEKLVGSYIEQFLNSRTGKRQSDKTAIGSAQPTVTLKSLSHFKIPLPSLEDQKAFAAEVQDMSSASAQLEERLRSIKHLRGTTLSGLLK